jgi:hypothetical protein
MRLLPRFAGKGVPLLCALWALPLRAGYLHASDVASLDARRNASVWTPCIDASTIEAASYDPTFFASTLAMPSLQALFREPKPITLLRPAPSGSAF